MSTTLLAASTIRLSRRYVFHTQRDRITLLVRPNISGHLNKPRRSTFSSGTSKTVTESTTAESTTTSTTKAATAEATTATKSSSSSSKSSSWWTSAEFWGAAGAIAGWGMSGAAIYDALQSGPELISLNMTGVLIVYSSLFARWAYVVKPQNMLLCACHVTNVIAQCNQMRRALEHKLELGQKEQVQDIALKAGATAVGGLGAVIFGPTIQSALVSANLGPLSTIAAADAGPFTVHFWAPMSKWLISGASFLDLHRPTDKISLAQYTALTLTGMFFSRYALLVTPINYTLCSVNIALFGSSAWHLGRKVHADFIVGEEKEEKAVVEKES